jgi:hypothetical protein
MRKENFGLWVSKIEKFDGPWPLRTLSGAQSDPTPNNCPVWKQPGTGTAGKPKSSGSSWLPRKRNDDEETTVRPDYEEYDAGHPDLSAHHAASHTAPSVHPTRDEYDGADPHLGRDRLLQMPGDLLVVGPPHSSFQTLLDLDAERKILRWTKN